GGDLTGSGVLRQRNFKQRLIDPGVSGAVACEEDEILLCHRLSALLFLKLDDAAVVAGFDFGGGYGDDGQAGDGFADAFELDLAVAGLEHGERVADGADED